MVISHLLGEVVFKKLMHFVGILHVFWTWKDCYRKELRRLLSFVEVWGSHQPKQMPIVLSIVKVIGKKSKASYSSVYGCFSFSNFEIIIYLGYSKSPQL